MSSGMVSPLMRAITFVVSTCQYFPFSSWMKIIRHIGIMAVTLAYKHPEWFLGLEILHIDRLTVLSTNLCDSIGGTTEKRCDKNVSWFKFRMLYFFGVKGVIRSYRSAQELKADTLTPASHLALTTLTPLSPLTPKKLSNLRNLSFMIIRFRINKYGWFEFRRYSHLSLRFTITFLPPRM